MFAAIFVAFPLYQGVQTAFYGLTLIDPTTPFVGLENFARLFESPDFLDAARFTIVFAVVAAAVESSLPSRSRRPVTWSGTS